MDIIDANDRFDNHLLFIEGVAELLEEQGQAGMAGGLHATAADMRTLQITLDTEGGELRDRTEHENERATLRFYYNDAWREVKVVSLRMGREGLLIVGLEFVKDEVPNNPPILKSYYPDRIGFLTRLDEAAISR